MSVYIESEEHITLPDTYREVVEDIVDASLAYLSCPYPATVEVFFTDNEGIRLMNNDHRGIDAPTDVLSFPMLDYEQPGDFSCVSEGSPDQFDPETGELLLGDIVLNVDRIISQAEEYGHTRRRELAFLVAHSMLHLSGYDHMEDEERLVMEETQEHILLSKGYTREDEKEI